jgi:hypothetical protein
VPGHSRDQAEIKHGRISRPIGIVTRMSELALARSGQDDSAGYPPCHMSSTVSLMRLRIAGCATAAAVVAVLAVCANPASARLGALPKPCTAAFPGAASKTIGRTTWYNRQRSVEYVVCDGFGLRPNADFPITADFVCALVSQAVGPKAERLSFFIDGACSADAIASDPKEPATYLGVACSWTSDLLEKVATPVGVLGTLGCAAAPPVGTALGNILESRHELDVAADIVGKGKCLKYSPTHFGSPWLAITCSSTDSGFTNLPQQLGTISLSTDGGFIYTVNLNGQILPQDLGASRLRWGKPASVTRIGYKQDPDCQLTWPAEHVTAVFFHGYGGTLASSSCNTGGTLRVQFGAGWQTDTGIAVGSTLTAMQQAYPVASSHGSTWGLIESYPPWGGTVDALAAKIRNGLVAALIVAGPESWDE